MSAKDNYKEYGLVAGTVTVALLVHHWFTDQLHSYVPWPFLLGIVLAFCTRNPWPYIIPLALIAEIFTTLPIGVITVIVITPLLVRRFALRIPADLSFSFFFLIAVIAAIQIAVIQVAAAARLVVADQPTYQAAAAIVPSVPVALSWVLLTVLGYGMTVVWRELLPVTGSVSSLSPIHHAR